MKWSTTGKQKIYSLSETNKSGYTGKVKHRKRKESKTLKLKSAADEGKTGEREQKDHRNESIEKLRTKEGKQKKKQGFMLKTIGFSIT